MSNWGEKDRAEYRRWNMLSFEAYLRDMSRFRLCRASHTDLDKDRVQWGEPTRFKWQLC